VDRLQWAPIPWMRTVPAEPTQRPWRRFLRFSVRGMIVLVLVIGAGLGRIVHDAHVQRDAVAAILRAGGVVEYDWQRRNRNSIPGGEPSAPRWLVHLIGGDYFGHVTAVWLSHMKETDATLADVGHLTRLEELYINSQAISDAGLEHLTGLTKLSVLSLYRTQVTDAGLAHLKGLTNLSYLGLGGTRVTDAGLAQLKGLTNLTRLVLSNTQVTDAGEKELQHALPGLKITR
jgi:internalin A